MISPTASQLPAAPSFARAVPELSAAQITGKSCYVAYDMQKGRLQEANGRVVRFRRWYEAVKKEIEKAK